MTVTPPSPTSRILVGTCGYSYPEWAAAGVYPAGTRAADMLALYARQFAATELNFTWYQMPRAPTIERMRGLAPEGFCFTAKLTRTLTHEVDPAAWRGQAALYRDGVAPIVQSGQLAAVLLQFPPTFTRSPEARRYLSELLDELQGLPLAVEFRHRSWAHDRVFAELERRRACLVAVDAPPLPDLFPRLDVVTHPGLFYVRFHGRNERGWRTGNKQAQFDYDYRDAELREWTEGPLRRMAAQAASGVVFFNNHVRGQAPRNAAQLTRLLASS